MEHSEIDNYVMSMGLSSYTKKTPVVFEPKKTTGVSSLIPIEYKDKTKSVSEKEQVIKCSQCNEVISVGSTPGTPKKAVIFCFKCNRKIEVEDYKVNEQNPLWIKPKQEKLRKEYEILLKQKVLNNIKCL